MKQELERNITQQVRLVDNFFTESKLKLKEGIHKTCVRQIKGVSWIIPMCVAKTCVPFGNSTG
jgi:hypothetical protein